MISITLGPVSSFTTGLFVGLLVGIIVTLIDFKYRKVFLYKMLAKINYFILYGIPMKYYNLIVDKTGWVISDKVIMRKGDCEIVDFGTWEKFDG